MEGNIGANLHVFGFGNDFLYLILKSQETKDKMDTLDLIKLKLLCIKGYYQESEKTTHKREEYLKIMYLIRV